MQRVPTVDTWLMQQRALAAHRNFTSSAGGIFPTCKAGGDGEMQGIVR